jgi:hypothetical protein
LHERVDAVEAVGVLAGLLVRLEATRGSATLAASTSV